MFGFGKKKKKPEYEFDENDREMAAMRLQYKKIRNSIERQKLRNLKIQAENIKYDGNEKPQESGIRKTLRDLKDLDELRNYLTPEQEEQLDSGDENMETKLLLQLITQGMKAQNPNVPDTPEGLRNVLQNQSSESKQDDTEKIIAALPPHVRAGIQSGKIPKVVAQKFAVDYAKKQFDLVWNRLQTQKQNKKKKKK